MPNRSLALLPFTLLAACSFQRYSATKTVDYTVPLDGVQQLVCRSHNGGITVVGDAAATEIALRAEITARASSQVDADALLHELEVRRDIVDGCLTVVGKGPNSDWTSSSVFSFTITLPPRTAVEVHSHNGNLRLQAMQGDIVAETHNGEVVGEATGAHVSAVTHNGDVRLTFGSEVREATIETHNGEVVVTLDTGHDAQVDASTHNGRIRCDLPLQDTKRERNRLSGRLGDGKGTLRITTHNGDVVLK